MQRVFVDARQRHQALEIEHEIDALRRRLDSALERAFELQRAPPRLGIALGGALAQLDQAQHFARQHVADAGDDAAGAAIDDAMEHLGVDADHQRDLGRSPGDVFGGVAQRLRAAEFLESDEMGDIGSQDRRTVRRASGSRNRGCCR